MTTTHAHNPKSVYKFTRSNLDETLELVYDYLLDYIKKHGFAPAVRDICEGVDIRSTSTVHSHLKRLVEAGRIVYTPGKRRAIALPQEVMQKLQKASPSALAADEEDGLDEGYDALQRLRTRYIPVIGTVTAGLPILAAEQIDYLIPFPADYFREDQSLFMLKIRGDSMMDAAILDGDLVLVEKTPRADYGKIIVALIDDEATVKRLIKHEGKPYLKAENPAYGLIPFYSPSCSILGQVTHVLRTHVR